MSDHIATESLTVRVVRSERRREIWIDGELDGGEIGGLQQLLDDAVSGEQVVLHAGGLSFVDSMGLRLLVEWHRRLEEIEGRLVLRDPSAALRRLLSATRLAEVMHLEDRPPSDS